MKKLVVLVVLVIAGLAIMGYVLLDRSNDNNGGLFDETETMIGFSALSSVMTLHNNLDDTAVHQPQSMYLSNGDQADTFDILAEIDDLTPYLDLVSSFMGEGNNFNVDVSTSDHEDYEHQMIISTVNMEGETINYTLHYNETFEDDEEDFDPEEYDSVIEGIMIIDEVTYTLYGERQIDLGEDSLELEAKLDDENYVTLDYEIEIESDEHSFEFDYEMYRDGQLVMSIEIEFEEDDEETELSLKFIKGNRESEFDFEVEIDGDERTVEIEYKISVDGNVIEEGEAEVKIVYNAETDQYVIRYEIQTKGEEVTVDVDYPRAE